MIEGRHTITLEREVGSRRKQEPYALGMVMSGGDP
jgi:hypothetical protein